MLPPCLLVKSSNLAKFLQASWGNRKWCLRGWKTSTTRRGWVRSAFRTKPFFTRPKVAFNKAFEVIFDLLERRVAFVRLKYLQSLQSNIKHPKDLFHLGRDRIFSEKNIKFRRIQSTMARLKSWFRQMAAILTPYWLLLWNKSCPSWSPMVIDLFEIPKQKILPQKYFYPSAVILWNRWRYEIEVEHNTT